MFARKNEIATYPTTDERQAASRFNKRAARFSTIIGTIGAFAMSSSVMGPKIGLGNELYETVLPSGGALLLATGATYLIARNKVQNIVRREANARAIMEVNAAEQMEQIFDHPDSDELGERSDLIEGLYVTPSRPSMED